MERDPRRPGGWDDAIGAAPSFLACLRALEARGEGDAPVLLIGPAGAGKAHLARLLARWGPRGRGPLVVVDAARLSPRRLDVVLFGHCHGNKGLAAFERAAGGAVLIRRVELIDPEMQQRLGRMAVARRARRTGARQDVPQDARLLFTARSGPGGRIEGLDPGFAADLGPGLLPVPSLSERPGDAAELAARFVGQALRARGLSARALGLTEVGRALFERAVWEGGVAQLEQVVEELLDRRLRALRVDAAPQAADPVDLDDGPAPVDLAAVRAVALAG